MHSSATACRAAYLIRCAPFAQVNEFHNAPNAFFFTSPLNSTVLPTLRVSGEGVLTEFGFNVGRVQSDVLMVVLIGTLSRNPVPAS